MLTEAEALERVLSAVQPLEPETAPLAASLGRFASQNLSATIALPGFDNSQVDGYAVRAAEAQTGSILTVTGEQPAGTDLQRPLASSQAVRIFTGAPLPVGCNAVVMQEDVSRDNNRITIHDGVREGENIRRRGSDLCEGQIILKRGDLITPALIGVLASQGLTTAPVHRLPRAAALGTGDEVMPPGTVLQPGQIYNSNGPMLAALLAQQGIPATLHHCRDDLQATTTILHQLIAEHEVILISGGVSVGDHDHVKPALHALGIQPQLWRVKVKPGKPFLFAQGQGCHIFGLPGNPVSAFVTYHLFVKAALMKLSGHPHSAPTPLTATTGRPLENPSDRPHYLRGKLEHGIFHPAGLQQSHALHGLSQCNALARVPEHTTLAVGSPCEVRWL